MSGAPLWLPSSGVRALLDRAESFFEIVWSALRVLFAAAQSLVEPGRDDGAQDWPNQIHPIDREWGRAAEQCRAEGAGRVHGATRHRPTDRHAKNDRHSDGETRNRAIRAPVGRYGNNYQHQEEA